jgi:leucyl aminopeptidase (aminopeptidase T)
LTHSALNNPGESGPIPDFAEAALAPIEGSAEGVVVIDGSIASLGLVRAPVVLKIKEGRVTEISGREEAQNLRNLLKNTDANSNCVAELGVGTVSRGKVIGAPDDKRILGTGHIGLGDNRFGGGNIASDLHIDSVFMNMTLELDGRIIMEDGVLKI